MSGPEPVASVESVGTDGIVLRVEFLKVGDRLTHRFVALDENGDSMVLLEAIEADLQEKWPCSPVLQELNLETVGEARQLVAMLVGKAGQAHWSVVFRPTEDVSAARLVIEVACRVKSLPAWVGSSYSLGKEVERLATEHCAGLETQLGSFRLLTLPVDEPQISLCQLAIQQDRLVISAECSTGGTAPTTIQWRYGVLAV